jgi:hypothetical protein
MKWLGQIVQAIVFVLAGIGFFAYVEAMSDQPESTIEKPIGDPEEVFAAAKQPLPCHQEFHEPRYECVPTRAQVPQRQREHDRERALAVGLIELP